MRILAPLSAAPRSESDDSVIAQNERREIYRRTVPNLIE